MTYGDDVVDERSRRERVAEAAGRIGRTARDRGGEAANRAVGFARENPFPTALAGLGLGLLAVAVLGGSGLRRRVRERGAAVGSSAQDRPWTVGAAAFGLGAAAGYLLPRAAASLQDRWDHDADGDSATEFEDELQGEGDYQAARRYREATEAFVEDDNPTARARAAAEEWAREPAALRRAEAAGRRPAEGSASRGRKPTKLGNGV
ncbi:hypothetical protein [Algihabitans albus]|uniref:hypothetical protein n=1 Tax=Algihabitans albus TaxID=2164067 RepID=UPI000E5D5D19|nr:hypothetical protein [Algihabitans albus]